MSSEIKQVSVQGWVRNVNGLGQKYFVRLNDGMSNSMIQVVVPKKLCEKIHFGSALKIVGDWVVSKGAQQPMELIASQCHVFGVSEEQLRQQIHLRAKSHHYAALLRLRSRLTMFSNKFFENNGFLHFDPPIISVNDCEGAGETFEVQKAFDADFFGTDVTCYLSVSSQLFLEAAACAFPKVYTICPAFRADKSTTSQHLSEFRMLEVECTFETTLDGICDIIEEYLNFLTEELANCCAADIDECRPFRKQNEPKLKTLVEGFKKPLPRITYTEAKEILGKLCLNFDASTNGLNKQQEFALVQEFGGPLAECFDLLAPFVGELAGGSVREWDTELLASRDSELTSGKLAWYLDLRRNGYPKSAGFGLGIERLMQSLFGIANIRDTIPFPRWYKHCRC